jgi:hypothetical protein
MRRTEHINCEFFVALVEEDANGEKRSVSAAHPASWLPGNLKDCGMINFIEYSHERRACSYHT